MFLQKNRLDLRDSVIPITGTGTTAGAVYFGYIDTDMMERSSARPAAIEMFDNTPPFGHGLKPRTTEYAAGKIVWNIELFAATGFSHFDVNTTVILHGLLQVLDDATALQNGIGQVIRKHYGG